MWYKPLSSVSKQLDKGKLDTQKRRRK